MLAILRENLNICEKYCPKNRKLNDSGWSAVFFSEFRECLQPSEKHTRLCKLNSHATRIVQTLVCYSKHLLLKREVSVI